MGDRWDGIPADAFANILQRLPPSPRWRLRLVCRHWRNVIDDRTPRPQARAKVLAVVAGRGRPRADVFDDLTEEATCVGRDLRLRGGAAEFGASIIGSCNGLLCLHRRSGDVVVVNPVTGEKLPVLPPPSRTTSEVLFDAAAYSFAYHPATGQYKIVHVPCRGDDGGTFDVVHVFTLGDRSWREVPVPPWSSWLLSFGLVSVNGATYWVSNDARTVMSFDLKDERVEFAATLPVPVPLWLHHSWRLTTDDINGRLGLAVCSYEMKRDRKVKGSKTEVWTKEVGGRNGEGTPWVLRHTIAEPGESPLQQIAWPHVVHGEHFLSTQATGGDTVSLHAYRLSKEKTCRGVVRMEPTPPPSIGLYGDCRSLRTLVYVETTEPLALYGCDDVGIDDDEEWDWRFDHWRGLWKLVPRSTWLHNMVIN